MHCFADAGVLDELVEEDDLKLSQEDLKILDTILASPPKAAVQEDRQTKSGSRGRGRGRGRKKGGRSKEEMNADVAGEKKKPR